MSTTNLDILRENIDPSTLREAAEGTHVAVGLTDDEVVTARDGWGGRAQIERYPLTSLATLRVHPSLTSPVLRLSFEGRSSRTLTITYRNGATPDFDRIVALLGTRLNGHASAPQPAMGTAPATTDAGEKRAFALRVFGPPVLAFLIVPALLMYVLRLVMD